MADVTGLLKAYTAAAPFWGSAQNLAYSTAERLSLALQTLGLLEPELDALADQADARESGDRRLPSPYDKLSADDRATWLVLEGLYDGALTDDVRRANAGHPMTEWADLVPDAQQALAPMLVQMIQVVHAVALNPEARAQAVATDG